MSTGLLVALLVALAVIVLVTVWLAGIANRMDRLHVRTDAAWAGLDAALARRAVVTRALDAATDAATVSLRAAADRAEHAGRTEREAEENELTRLLGELDRDALPGPLAEELADAELRVVLARRVHNDAVRNALSQRRRRVVRWLRLAGTAPRPEYFEIAEPELTDDLALPVRVSARLLLVNAEDRVLLFNGHEPREPEQRFWFTVGGGVENGEQLLAAALRELAEETGLTLPDGALVGPVWVRRKTLPLGEVLTRGEEWYFLARAAGLPGDWRPDTSGFNQLERDTIVRHRWWSAEELAATEETVYPEQLTELLPALLADGWDGSLRTVS